MFNKILIANRGEIACRVAATARALGVQTVAMYSDADTHAQHVAACDEAVHIGGNAPRDSYLRAERIVDVSYVWGDKTLAEAVEHQRFGGDFSYSRMSWIKPNFLWMMFRSGWATKEGQEHILAIKLCRTFFDKVLEAAVASSFRASGFHNHEEWQLAVANSDVRLQWDPDHDPSGAPQARRAIQSSPSPVHQPEWRERPWR